MGQKKDSATKCYELIEVRPLEGAWSGLGRKSGEGRTWFLLLDIGLRSIRVGRKN